MSEKNDDGLICVPGQRLCLVDGHTVGRGTYERHGYIFSSLAGEVHVTSKDNSILVEVHSSNDQSIVPVPGDIVTARVTIVNPRFCKCSIICVAENVLFNPYRGVLRREDVRATEKDRVEMYKSYRPGDIILARVLPMGEMNTYQLSTAENELGVVIAQSESGVPMVPISWCEMQCPKTYNKEPRKVAKVLPESVLSELTSSEL